jgi:hypothetical protein
MKTVSDHGRALDERSTFIDKKVSEEATGCPLVARPVVARLRPPGRTEAGPLVGGQAAIAMASIEKLSTPPYSMTLS